MLMKNAVFILLLSSIFCFCGTDSLLYKLEKHKEILADSLRAKGAIFVYSFGVRPEYLERLNKFINNYNSNVSDSIIVVQQEKDHLIHTIKYDRNKIYYTEDRLLDLKGRENRKVRTFTCSKIIKKPMKTSDGTIFYSNYYLSDCNSSHNDIFIMDIIDSMKPK
jgi:hypothetical protein